MRPGRKNIALFMGILESEYSYSVLQGAMIGAREADVNLLIFPMGFIRGMGHERPENGYGYQYNALGAFLKSKSIDGAVVEYGTIVSCLPEKEKQNFFNKIGDIPTILISEDAKSYHSVLTGSRMLAYRAVLAVANGKDSVVADEQTETPVASRKFLTELANEKTIRDESRMALEMEIVQITHEIVYGHELEKERTEAVLRTLKRLGFSSGYVLLYDKPMHHPMGVVFEPAEKINMKGYFGGSGRELSSKEGQSAFQRDHLFEKDEMTVDVSVMFHEKWLAENRRFELLVLPLFFRDKQYGLMMAEGDITYFRLASRLANQVGSALEILNTDQAVLASSPKRRRRKSDGAEHAQEAVEETQPKHYAPVFMDHMMPAAPEENSTPEETPEQHILVVDDSKLNLKIVKDILEKYYKISLASSGMEALHFLQETKDEVDLILLDLFMPGMDGFEVIRMLHDDKALKEIPVIFLTADMNHESEVKGFEEGAVDFITKPFSPKVMLRRVHRVLELHHLQKYLTEEVERQTEMSEQRREKVERLSLQSMTAMAAAIDAKDHYTNGHSSRVAKYARMIAEKTGKSEKEQEEIYYIGLLHDVGKIGIPDEIINKPSKLSDEEFNIIKQHPFIGAKILSTIKEIPNIEIGAHWHHERYDGKGYPDGLAGKAIPEIARIIGVSDAYDAMTSYRSYRGVMPQEKVRDQIIQGKGTQFDPDFADAMLAIMDEDTEYQLHETHE